MVTTQVQILRALGQSVIVTDSRNGVANFGATRDRAMNRQPGHFIHDFPNPPARLTPLDITEKADKIVTAYYL